MSARCVIVGQHRVHSTSTIPEVIFTDYLVRTTTVRRASHLSMRTQTMQVSRPAPRRGKRPQASDREWMTRRHDQSEMDLLAGSGATK